MKIFFLLEIFGLHLKNQLRSFFNRAPVPYKWLIQLTNDCNSRCTSCDIWKINKVNSDLKKAETTISQYESLFKKSGKGLRWLALSGGEVSLYQEMDQFLELVKQYCPHLKLITFTTNAILNENILNMAKMVRAMKIDFFIVISMDGNEKLHDSSRGIAGNFKLAQNLFESLKLNGVNVLYGTTLNLSNVDYWSENLDPNVKSISLLHSGGIFNKPVALDDLKLYIGLKKIMTKYRIKNLSELGEFVYLRLAVLFLKSERKETPVPCNVLSSSLHIYPNGDVHPCMYLPAVGNIKHNSLEDILAGNDAKKERHNALKGNCSKCWMNCYAPHSISEYPFRSLIGVVKSYL
jgi:MoaA/NifB/PqqE/SkfB family radical SAM enzyme